MSHFRSSQFFQVIQRLSFLLLIVLTASCKSSVKEPNQKEIKAFAKEALNLNQPAIELGFNAKGTLNTPEQVSLFGALLDTLSENLKQHLHVRVSGGTLSQRQLPADWSDSDIQAWIDLQTTYGFGLVYVVNGNDSPESQVAFIDKWLSMGAKFTFIELMNEYYLSKYQKGDLSKPGVTRKVDVDDYLKEIVPAFASAFAKFDIPLYLICAPMKGKSKQDDYNRQWNEAVAAFMHQGMAGLTFGAAVHYYFDGGNFNYDQIDDLRALLPKGSSIAVTESGLSSRTEMDYNKVGSLTTSHYRSIASHLSEGDFIFDHVLYNDYNADQSATLHPNYKGVSPKGMYVLAWMHSVHTEEGK